MKAVGSSIMFATTQLPWFHNHMAQPKDHSLNIWNKGIMNFKTLTKSLQHIMDKIKSHFPSLFGLLGKQYKNM